MRGFSALLIGFTSYQFLSALLRQSNPNWDAYFFVTDDHLFDNELKVILSKYGDIRLNYLEIDMKFRPKVFSSASVA